MCVFVYVCVYMLRTGETSTMQSVRMNNYLIAARAREKHHTKKMRNRVLRGFSRKRIYIISDIYIFSLFLVNLLLTSREGEIDNDVYSGRSAEIDKIVNI